MRSKALRLFLAVTLLPALDSILYYSPSTYFFHQHFYLVRDAEYFAWYLAFDGKRFFTSLWAALTRPPQFNIGLVKMTVIAVGFWVAVIFLLAEFS